MPSYIIAYVGFFKKCIQKSKIQAIQTNQKHIKKKAFKLVTKEIRK